MMSRRLCGFGLLCLGLLGCLPHFGGSAHPEDDDFSTRLRRRPAELQRDQVWIELISFRVSREEEAALTAQVSYYERITDRYPAWKENGLAICRGEGNFRISLEAWLKRHREIQTKSYGIMVQNGALGSLMIQELYPRRRVDVYTGGRVAESHEWVNVMGGLEVQPILGQGDSVELTVTPLIHYYDSGDTHETRLIDLRTAVHLRRGGTLLIGSMESRENTFGTTFFSYRSGQKQEKILLSVTVW